MESLAQELVHTGALQFGSFETKSGRLSPYFINTGKLYKSLVLQKIAKQTLMILSDKQIGDVDFFGPAYKGISLAAVTCMAAAELTGGTALRQTHKQLRSSGLNKQAACVVVVLDRQEIGQKVSAKKEVEDLYGCPVCCLASIDSLIHEIEGWKEKPPGYDREAIDNYRKQYGA
jgi:orotate phosphoribosyltransferase